MRMRVVKTYEVEVNSFQEGLDATASMEASMTTARVLEEDPGEGHRYESYFEQPIATLDVAWDRYMDCTISRELRQQVTPHIDEQVPKLPTLVELGEGRLNPVHLSLLFDCAITAYRDAFEGSVDRCDT